MKRSTDRILTTHVGSLVRPSDLLEYVRAQNAGESYDKEGHATLLKRSVAEVVQRQAEAGVDVNSDGECGKSSFLGYLHNRLTGFTPQELGPGDDPRPVTARGGRDRTTFAEFYAEYDQTQHVANPPPLVCTGPISYSGHEILKRDLGNFRAALDGVSVEDAFVAAIAPGNFGRGENVYYPSDEAFHIAVAEAMKEEFKAITDAGFLLQIDAPVGSYDTLSLSKEEFRRRLEMSIEALNHALEGIPEEKVRYHVCWGSWNAPHTFDIPLVDFVDIVFKAHASAISIEAANARHEHEFEIWEDVKLPDGKILIPGVTAHTTNVVEHPELVALRIKNFAKLVGRENVIAGTDCGFAQGAFTRRVHPSIMWAKLQALAEGARLATKELWAH